MPRDPKPSGSQVISIYRIKNAVSGKAYIGQTSGTIEARFNQHRSKAANGSKHLLHAAMREYGANSFTKECIAVAHTEDEGYDLESKFIADEKTHGHGCNMTDGGETPDPALCSEYATEIWSRPAFRILRKKRATHRRRSKAASKAAKEIWSRPEFREARKKATAKQSHAASETPEA